MKFNTIDDLKAIPVSRDSFQWLNCKPTVRQYPEQQECIWLSIQGKIYPSFSPAVQEDSLKGKTPMCR